MSINSEYFDSIRIRSGKKNGHNTPQCQWDGCGKPGLHRAPSGSRRNRQEQYFHLCIDHVRTYNKNFNYFSSLSYSEDQRFQKDAATQCRLPWQKSLDATVMQASQHFSHLRSGTTASYRTRLRNPRNSKHTDDRSRQRKLKILEAKALATLSLKENASKSDIKAQYRALIKLHHPDSNGGDRSSENRFREILQAYNLLKKAGFC